MEELSSGLFRQHHRADGVICRLRVAGRRLEYKESTYDDDDEIVNIFFFQCLDAFKCI